VPGLAVVNGGGPMPGAGVVQPKLIEQAALASIYILERDSKYVYEYDLVKKQVFRRTVNIAASF